jgi:hypothetical protein
MRALNRNVVREFNPDRKDTHWGKRKLRRMTVFVCVDTIKKVGDLNHLKVSADEKAADRWFEENDPEGVAFEYPILE